MGLRISEQHHAQRQDHGERGEEETSTKERISNDRCRESFKVCRVSYKKRERQGKAEKGGCLPAFTALLSLQGPLF